MPRPILKIYGERNSGTNYLEQLAARNLNATILPGRAPDRHPQAYLARILCLFSPEGGVAYRRAWHDAYLRGSFDKTLGWKHMNPAVDRLGPERLETIRFAMIVKNPYSWLLSLFRRPHHVGDKDQNLDAFLKRRMPVMEEMENIGSDQIGPVEVWNRKVAGYFSLCNAAHHAAIVNYEDFLEDDRAALEHLAKALNITQRAGFTGIDRGIKSGDAHRRREDYVDFYLNERWRAELTSKTVETINRELDVDLVARLGYRIIDPSEIPVRGHAASRPSSAFPTDTRATAPSNW